MNFTHFLPASENLNPGELPMIFLNLLRRGAVLQLVPN
jgi:hypothetical protein